MTPYLSIDIETTGLVPEAHQVIQVGAVWDDGGPIDDLKKTCFLVKPMAEHIVGNAFALQMNSALLKQIATGESEYPILDQVKAITFFKEFLTQITGSETDKVYVAGKNVAGFDIPFLKWAGFPVERFKHRVIDPGSLYLKDFGYPPSLTEINEKLDLGAVSHTALDDALNVVKVIRAGMTASS